MPYRPYQNEIHAATLKYYDEGIRQQLISAATGTGKTQTFAGLPDLFRSRLPGQTLVLAHREELIDQAIGKMTEINPTAVITKEMGGTVGNPFADIIVGSVATLGKKGTKRTNRFDWDKIDKVITDEAHHATSDSYTNVYTLADVLRPDTHKLHVGFTATPQRADGKALAQVFRKIAYEYSMRRAINEGYLVEPKGIRVKTTTSLTQVKVSGGDFNISSLSDAINTPERNQLVVKAWLDHGKGSQTIGFTADIKHAQDLAAMFAHYGVKAEAVWGDDPERADKISRHKSTETTVLLNCGVLTEGYDDPQIACVLLARPTKSGVLYTQMVGRGTRLFPGKTGLIVIDVVDASSKNSLLTLPTLMGLSASLDLKGRGVVWAVEQIEKEAKEYPHIDFSQLADIDSLKTFIENVNLFDVTFPPEVETNSILSWMPSVTGGYTLLLPKPKDSEFFVKADQVSISQNLLDKFEITGSIKGKKYRGERDTIGEAFIVADTLIQDKAPEVLKLLKREEPWHKEPATEAQLKMLARFTKGKAIPKDLDKGRASKLISSYMSKKG